MDRGSIRSPRCGQIPISTRRPSTCGGWRQIPNCAKSLRRMPDIELPTSRLRRRSVRRTRRCCALTPSRQPRTRNRSSSVSTQRAVASAALVGDCAVHAGQHARKRSMAGLCAPLETARCQRDFGAWHRRARRTHFGAWHRRARVQRRRMTKVFDADFGGVRSNCLRRLRACRTMRRKRLEILAPGEAGAFPSRDSHRRCSGIPKIENEYPAAYVGTCNTATPPGLRRRSRCRSWRSITGGGLCCSTIIEYTRSAVGRRSHRRDHAAGSVRRSRCCVGSASSERYRRRSLERHRGDDGVNPASSRSHRPPAPR